MRKVEKYEIADGRTYDCPKEALKAELVASICAAIPCSMQIGENILQRWQALTNLVEQYNVDCLGYKTRPSKAEEEHARNIMLNNLRETQVKLTP